MISRSAQSLVKRKPRVAFELAIALIICRLTQGCVGVFVNKTKTELVQNPGVGATATAGEVFEAKATDQIRSAAWVKKHWGDPASIRALQSEDHTELWTYRLRPVWCGVVVGAIVPIPLFLPMASESVTFSVQEVRS